MTERGPGGRLLVDEPALAGDLRIASADARLGMPPGRLGLVYSHTGVRRFIDAIGAPRTRELFLVGSTIDAATGLQWGLVNSVCDPAKLSDAALLATRIAANAPLAQSGKTRVIDAVLDGLTPALERELLALRDASFASEDFREGVRAFSEKRSPRWQGR